jgi:phenylalanyl-tRNA synthetase beta chain
VEAGNVIRAARGAERGLISGVELFDVYDGKNIEDGKKSLAIQVTLQPVEATLTDEEIDKVAANIVAAVEKATGGSLRG